MDFQRKLYGKVIATLESKKINYLVIEPRNNYDVEEKSDNKNLNTYEEEFKKSYTTVKQKEKVEKIKERLELYIISLLQKILAKVKVIDFLLNLSYDREIITSKKYLKLANRIDDITKYTTGWLSSMANTNNKVAI